MEVPLLECQTICCRRRLTTGSSSRAAPARLAKAMRFCSRLSRSVRPFGTLNVTSKVEWLRCKAISRAELRASGGCYWPVKPNSPGNSIKIPNGTAFRVKYEGPESHIYVNGVCEKASFHVTQGKASGFYPSASSAVNAIRSHVEQTNAYLYIEFMVDNIWRLADDLRYNAEFSVPVDYIEERIMEDLREKVREKCNKGGIKLGTQEVEAKAEIAFDKNPDYVARMRAAYS